MIFNDLFDLFFGEGWMFLAFLIEHRKEVALMLFVAS